MAVISVCSCNITVRHLRPMSYNRELNGPVQMIKGGKVHRRLCGYQKWTVISVCSCNITVRHLRPLSYNRDLNNKVELYRRLLYLRAVSCDFQQCGILTIVDSDEPVQPPFRLRNSKRCSVSSFILVEHSNDKQRL